VICEQRVGKDSLVADARASLAEVDFQIVERDGELERLGRAYPRFEPVATAMAGRAIASSVASAISFDFILVVASLAARRVGTSRARGSGDYNGVGIGPDAGARLPQAQPARSAGGNSSRSCAATGERNPAQDQGQAH
jgi:hypothetical protein